MRRGEWAVLALFAAGLAMWLAPSRRERPAPPPEAEAAWTAALADPALADSASPRVAPAEGRAITLDDYDLDPRSATRWKLPGRLQEISGLALSENGTVLAHDDEEGTVFAVDLATGTVAKSFELTDARGRIDADFEGLAVAGGRVYLVTSDGHVYEAAEGVAGGRAPCVVYDTRLGKDYEIEGLAYEPGARELLLASKAARGTASRGPLYVFRWSTETKRLVEGGRIAIPVRDIAKRLGRGAFAPSGIERHPLSGNYVLVAGPQHALAEIAPDGTLLGARELSGQWHRQPEGITFAADGRLIVSDEGASKRARLTIYPLRPR